MQSNLCDRLLAQLRKEYQPSFNFPRALLNALPSIQPLFGDIFKGDVHKLNFKIELGRAALVIAFERTGWA